MEHMYLVIDYGSSSLKIAFSTELTECPQQVLMEPEVIEISPTIVEKYRFRAGFKGDPAAWTFVGIDNTYYAVGKLAREEFRSTPNLAELKSSSAAIRTLAAVFVAAYHCSLGKKFSLFLSCLLPPGEINEAEILLEDIKKALKSFDTPTGRHNVSLKYFNCSPEGGGLAMFYQHHRTLSPDRSLGVLMMGHRNTSAYLVRNGINQKLSSSDLGFSSVVHSIQSATSGYQEREITDAVALYLISQNKDRLILDKLLLHKTLELRNRELERLLVAIDEARSSYWKSVSQWLDVRFSCLDEAIVGGGVARIFESEIVEYFKHKLPNLPTENYPGMYFNGGLKYPQDTLIPLTLQDRFADVQCLWEQDIIPSARSYWSGKKMASGN
jgi:hypothetical protein